MDIFHGIVAGFFKRDGPYFYVRLVTAAYAVSAIGRLIPVKRKQVPGYRRRVPPTVWAQRSTPPPSPARQHGTPAITLARHQPNRRFRGHSG